VVDGAGRLKRRHVLAAMAAVGGLGAGGLLRFAQTQLVNWLRPPMVVRGAVSSDARLLFDSPGAREIFSRSGIEPDISPFDFQRVAIDIVPNLSSFDFLIYSVPSSSIEKLIHGSANNFAVTDKYAVPKFEQLSFSPLTIATFESLARLLVQVNVVRQAENGEFIFDVVNYLAIVERGLRWNQIAGNVNYLSPNRILIATSDPRTSTSAGMYAAIASYVLNNYAPVQNQEQAQRMAGRLAPLFLGQGVLSITTDETIERYFGPEGSELAPMVLTYESQFLSKLVLTPALINLGIKADRRVLMYPTLTVLAVQKILPLNEAGHLVGQLLMVEPGMRELETRAGFRSLIDGYPTLKNEMEKYQLTVPANLKEIGVNDTPLPTMELLESMINAIR